MYSLIERGSFEGPCVTYGWPFKIRCPESSLLHRHALREVSWLIYVAASADGDVVGEELEGDYFEDGEEEFVGGGMWMTCSTS